jgi:CRISPR-associated protein Cas1
MQLVVDKFGAFLGKHSERLRVSLKGEIVEERPFYELDHLLIASAGVSLSSDLVRECAERGIPISFLTPSGKPYARLMAPGLVGTVRTRREQLLAYTDRRGVALARAFAWGKVQNQANLLKYMAKYRKSTNPSLFQQVRQTVEGLEEIAAHILRVEGKDAEGVRQELLTLEGHAAQAYWEAAGELLIPEIGFEGRHTRGARDIVNAALNYGYGILYCQVERAVHLAGLDPYAGFLHADRSGKPSLVLDLIEEFRQMCVDKAVFALFNKGTRLKLEEGRLDEPSRRLLAEKVRERLEGEESYRGKKHKLRTVIQAQARHLAAFLRSEVPSYKPFVGRW